MNRICIAVIEKSTTVIEMGLKIKGMKDTITGEIVGNIQNCLVKKYLYIGIEMKIKTGFYTTAGDYKEVNQDSLCIQKAKSNRGESVMAVVCDGMGGLQHGEIASAECVKGFVDWFHDKLPSYISNGLEEKITECWAELAKRINTRIRCYGVQEGIQLGTTLAAILVLESGEYFGINVGDSRIYMCKEGAVRQLTEDHSWVAREVARGNMTWEEADSDSRRNLLLQCVGMTREIMPHCFRGKLTENSVFLLCSDGFWHEQSKEEISKKMERIIQNANVDISDVLKRMCIENFQKGEKDNITAVGIGVFP